MPTNWTDPTITTTTRIRLVHINELRSVVDKNRLMAGLGSYTWTNSPVSKFTYIRVGHFTEARNAIQDLWNHLAMGTIPNWTYGTAPSTSRQISARDITDLRNWIQQYENQAGPSFDPNYWGVDSAAASNSIYPNTTLTVFDYIAEQSGATPAYWGRYIGGNFALTPTEVSFLHGIPCKILLTYNGVDPTKLSAYQQGQNDGNNAISAATGLGVPAGVVIFADIEAGWQVTSAWIQGWSDTLFGSIYAGAGGLYGNTGSDPYFNSSYCAAYNADSKMRVADGFIWTTQPNQACTLAAGAPPSFTPTSPPCNDGAVVAWQYAIKCWLDPTMKVGVDENLVNATGYYYLW